MKTFYYFDENSSKIQTLTAQEVIAEFLRTTTTPKGIAPQYFIEELTLCKWESGKKVTLTTYDTVEECQQVLLDLAIDDAFTYENVTIYDDLQELIHDLKSYIEQDEDNVEYNSKVLAAINAI